jgi:hypothetical protein
MYLIATGSAANSILDRVLREVSLRSSMRLLRVPLRLNSILSSITKSALCLTECPVVLTQHHHNNLSAPQVTLRKVNCPNSSHRPNLVSFILITPAKIYLECAKLKVIVQTKKIMQSTNLKNIEEIKTIIFQLPIDQILTLISEIEEKVTSIAMMKLAETGFQEWNDPEEDIYNDD